MVEECSRSKHVVKLNLQIGNPRDGLLYWLKAINKLKISEALKSEVLKISQVDGGRRNEIMGNVGRYRTRPSKSHISQVNSD